MLTFEALREQERKEKSSSQIQKLPDDFVAQLQEYLQRKIEKSDGSTDDRRDITNIKNTISRLVEMREHKILDAVMYASRTGMKPDGLSEKEHGMFDVILKEVNDYRSEFLRNIESGKAVDMQQNAAKTDVDMKDIKTDERKYLVKRDVSRFVAPDLSVHELKQGDTLRERDLPKALNDLLLKRGVIEETK